MKVKNIRIRKSPKGYICEIRITKLFIFYSWQPFIKYNGSDSAFPYSSIYRCLNDLHENYLNPEEYINLTILP